jgi:hypothetical protein
MLLARAVVFFATVRRADLVFVLARAMAALLPILPNGACGWAGGQALGSPSAACHARSIASRACLTNFSVLGQDRIANRLKARIWRLELIAFSAQSRPTRIKSGTA